ncbi:orotidine-5'-phosphate decarboxylase [Paraburkholderia sediminicola]|uniref:orotidine-5'-phosphate decarboxylase n=1 Tax=Paraburkholderia sediminicola TaxID=458836 RepID=UPI0038BB4D0D
MNETVVSTTSPKDRICLAMDIHDEEAILRAVDNLGDLVGYFKLNSAFTLYGPELVKKILDKGAKIFLDLKLHDIPNTLAGYGDAVTRLGVHVVTVHVSGGSEMLRELVKSAERTAAQLGMARPQFIGITLMTSISQDILNNEINVQGSIEDEVLRKARMAAEAGLNGIVCSVGELDHVRQYLPQDFVYVTPGVRPAGASHHDHQRVYTYSEAIKAGSSLLVVGRTVLTAKDPRTALLDLHKVLGAA